MSTHARWLATSQLRLVAFGTSKNASQSLEAMHTSVCPILHSNVSTPEFGKALGNYTLLGFYGILSQLGIHNV